MKDKTREEEAKKKKIVSRVIHFAFPVSATFFHVGFFTCLQVIIVFSPRN